MGKQTFLAFVGIGIFAAACGDDGAATTDSSVVFIVDSAVPDATTPDARVPDARLPDADLTNAPPAFRVTKLWLRDPHLFTPPGLGGASCMDITDSSAIGFSANGQIQAAIDTDSDGDTLLDLSLIAVFDPLDPNATDGNLTVATGDCGVTNPRHCTQSALTTPQNTTYTNMATGVCMTPDPLTVSSANYVPGIAEPTDNCFASGSVTMSFDLGGVALNLQNVEVAAVYNGDPNVSTLITGLMRGFLSEEEAAAATLDTPLGPIALDTLLPGGSSCKLHDDRDLLDPNAKEPVSGWWFYLNFEATRLLGWSAP